MKIFTIILLFFAVCASSYANDMLGIDGEDATLVGVYIKDLHTGEVLYDYNSELAMTPASVMKIVTSSSALSILGEDFRFKTSVELTGAKTAGGVWQGDIIVHASGDPTIDSEFLSKKTNFVDSIYFKLKRLGINKLNGKIRVSETMSQAGPNVRWEIEDVAWPYGSGCFGFNYRDNTTVVYPLTGVTRPKVPDFKIEVVENSPKNDLVRGWGSNTLTAYVKKGTTNKWALQTSVPKPSAVFINALRQRLKDGGIALSDTKKGTSAASDSKTIYTHHSPKAIDILRSLMVRSDNLYAEAMLRATSPGTSLNKAIEKEQKLWTDRGVDASYSIIFDGSGLTRGNRLQPRFVAEILEWMAMSDKSEQFTSLFPLSGVSGTLKNFLARSPLKGKLALKTGSINAVQCYAGYKLDDNGKPSHVVVVFVNGFFCRRAEVRQAVEKLMSDVFLQPNEL